MLATKTRLMAVIAVILLALFPTSALATFCWVDDVGGLYSIELAASAGSKISLFGYRKDNSGCSSSVGDLAPLVGDAVIVNSTTVSVGWQVFFDGDSTLPNACTSFKETLLLDLTTGNMTGSFRNDGSVDTGSSKLTPSTCPSPAKPSAVQAPSLAPDGQRK